MYGIETAYCDAMISALLRANRALMETSVEEAVDESYVPYKGDTLGIDQIPENTIASELTGFDPYAVLITEERGEEANPLARESALALRGPRTFFVCDPCDRSSQFCAFLKEKGKAGQRVFDVLNKKSIKNKWEEKNGNIAEITGANAAITCVRRGLPICSVLLNFITQEIIIACSAGIFHSPLENYSNCNICLEDVTAANKLIFPDVVDGRARHLVTFMGKPERGYPQNFAMTRLAKEDDLDKQLYYNKPGGPTRILYLSEKQPQENGIGLIVANGEKIGEWIHWIPFIRYANKENDSGERALHLYEVTQDESALRDQYLMTPTEPYSVFKEITPGKVVINVDRLGEFNNPSKYRATLLVAPTTNSWAIGRAQQYGYRRLVFFGD